MITLLKIIGVAVFIVCVPLEIWSYLFPKGLKKGKSEPQIPPQRPYDSY